MRSWVGLAVATLVAAGCGSSKETAPEPEPEAPASKPWAVSVSDKLPASVPFDDYLGAEACKECHAEAYAAWATSAHARAMTKPSPETVLGAFDGREVKVPGGVVVPTLEGIDYRFEIRPDGGETKVYRVDLILASGRQQQTYYTMSDTGSYRILPAFWSTVDKVWLTTSLYVPTALDPNDPDYFAHSDLDILNCVSCHLSRRHREVMHDMSVFRYVDLSITCEACHGPGREHVAFRRDGAGAEPYKDLKALDKDSELRVCGQCHGARDFMQLPAAANGTPDPAFRTLTHTHLRPDGTQLNTAYQAAGHMVSRCFNEGAMTCSSCHAPHDQKARSLVGDPAEGDDSNKQCTVCHRDRIAPRAVAKHSRHPAKIRCIDCHMSMSWIGDSPERHQRTSDHTISIPRPQESLDVGTPNACTTCHADKQPAWALEALTKWDQKRALESRPWVEAVKLAQDGDAAAAPGLRAMLADESLPPYLHLSAVELLASLPADASLAELLEPRVASDSWQMRAYALRGLATHDPDDIDTWRRKALDDPHPFVRFEGLYMSEDGRGMTEDDLHRIAEDALRHEERPGQMLLDVADRLAGIGKLDNAVEVAELALRVSTRKERAELGFTKRAAVLQSRKAARDARRRAGK